MAEWAESNRAENGWAEQGCAEAEWAQTRSQTVQIVSNSSVK